VTRALFAAVSLLSFSVHAGETEQVFARVRDSVVTIVSFDERGLADAEGSGVVVANGQVVTNCHVVDESTAIKIKARDKEFGGTVALADLSRDLCALDVPGLVAPAVRIRSYKDVKVGERAFAVGNPLGFELSVSAGLMSMIGEYQGEPQLYTSAALSPGSSGGGLFDADGRLIGITTRVLTFGQNVNVALPADWISELPRRGKRPPAPGPGIQPDPDWSEQAEALRAAGKWGELLELSRRWQSAYPTSTDAQAFSGLALLNLDRPSEARDVLVKATQANPKHATARAYLGLVNKNLGATQAALEDLRVALELNPAGAYPRRATGEILLGEGRLEQAVATMEEAIRFDPGDDANWLVLGMVKHKQRRFDEAAKAYRTALRINPASVAARENLAGVLAAQGLAGEARETLAPLPVSSTADARTWLQIGVAEYQKGRYADAEKAFRKALALNPAFVEASLILARVLSATGRSAEAEDELNKAVKIRPELGDTWLELGEILSRRGARAQALEAFEKAVALSPSSGPAWRQLAYARRDKQDLAGAIAALEKVTQLEPKVAGDWAVLGEARYKLRRWDEGLAALKEAEKLDPRNEVALQGLASFYGTRGDFAQSLAYTERALVVNPASSHSWSNKGYTLLKLQRYGPASEALQTAVRLQPDNANAWINLWETYLRQGQLGKAITTLERACNLAPQAVDARIYVAQAYLGSGQPAKAKEHLDAIVAQQPELPMAWYMLTAVYISQGKPAETLDAYARLNRLNPALARDLKEKMRGKQLPGGVVLPD